MMKRLMLCIALVFAQVGCSTQQPTVQFEPQRLTCWIHAWQLDKDGKPDVMWLATSDGKQFKTIWMEIGDTVVFPDYFTWGKEAQAMPMTKIKEEWLKGTPGIYKMQEPSEAVKALFPGKKVELGK